MREFSSAVTTALNGKFKYFFLVELTFTLFNTNSNQYEDTEYYFTSYHRELSWNGNTYIADGGLFEFESPNFSSVLDREAYRIVLTDLSDEFSGIFKASIVGSPIKVHVGIVDPATDLPLLATDDVIQLYSGYIDSPAVKNDFDTKTAVIEGTSPMSDLDQINVYMISKDGMDQLSSTDTSYDNLYDNNEINLKWGKV